MALHGGYAKAHNAQDGGLIVELHFPHAGMPLGPIPGKEAATNPAHVVPAALLSAKVAAETGRISAALPS